MPFRGTEAPISRIVALRKKHAMYKDQIREAQKSPAAEYYLKQLKKQKLLVKEELEGLRESGRASA